MLFYEHAHLIFVQTHNKFSLLGYAVEELEEIVNEQIVYLSY